MPHTKVTLTERSSSLAPQDPDSKVTKVFQSKGHEWAVRISKGLLRPTKGLLSHYVLNLKALSNWLVCMYLNSIWELAKLTVSKMGEFREGTRTRVWSILQGPVS